MPNHSKSYLKRKDNPRGLFKLEKEHIKHFILRAKERGSLDLTLDDYHRILNKVTTQSRTIYRVNSSMSVVAVKYKGIDFWVLFGSKCTPMHGDNILPKRLKTFLIPNKLYIVPDRMSHLYDHQEFTVKVHETIEEIIKFSSTVDLTNKKDLFINHPEIELRMKKAAVTYLERGRDRNQDMIFRLAVKLVIERSGIVDKELTEDL